MSERYAAFISYSHADAYWARWLQRALEVYRLPAGLSSKTQLPRRLGKVFRDREELATGQNLGNHLTRALDKSDNLIVICSPNACASPWVAKEIEYFKAQGKTNRIFCLLVDGGTEALPEPLLTDAKGKSLEPLAADPRDSGDGKALAKLKLIAGILGLNLDQLTQREQARKRKRTAQIFGLVIAFLAAISWGVLSYQAYQREQRDAFEVVRNLTPLMTQSTNYIAKETLSEAASALNKWVQRIDNDSPIAGAVEVKARGMHGFAFASYELGNKEAALSAYRKARDLFEKAAAEDPENIDLAIDLAFADFYIGSVFFYDGNHEEAKTPFDAYQRNIALLLAEHPYHPLLISEAIDAPTTALANLSGLKKNYDQELEANIARVESIALEAIQKAPDQHSVRRAAYGFANTAAEALVKSCFVFEAVRYRIKAVEHAKHALDLDSSNRDYKSNLSNAYYSLGGTHMLLAEPAKAVPLYLQVDKLTDELLRGDPTNKYLGDRKLRNQLKLLAVATYHPEALAEFPLAEKIVSETDFLAEAAKLERDPLTLMAHFELAKHALSKGDMELAFDLSDELSKLAQQRSGGALRTDFAFAQIINSMLTPESSEQSTVLVASASDGESCVKRRRYWAEAILRGDDNDAKAIYEEAASLGLVGLEIPFFAKLLGLSYEASSTHQSAQ